MSLLTRHFIACAKPRQPLVKCRQKKRRMCPDRLVFCIAMHFPPKRLQSQRAIRSCHHLPRITTLQSTPTRKTPITDVCWFSSMPPFPYPQPLQWSSRCLGYFYLCLDAETLALARPCLVFAFTWRAAYVGTFISSPGLIEHCIADLPCFPGSLRRCGSRGSPNTS